MSDCKDLVFDFTELAGVLSLGQVRKEKSGLVGGNTPLLFH